VIDDRTAYGQGVAEEFSKAVKASGGAIAEQQFTTDKATDFTAILTQIKAKKPGRRLLRRHGRRGRPDAAPDEAARHQRQDDGRRRHLLERAAEARGRRDGDGQVVCAEAGGVEGSQKAGMDKFKEDFKKKFNADVQIYSPYVYDAVNVMVAAMVKAARPTRRCTCRCWRRRTATRA
jgi:branched-chain amino acid transport system substrate-binding protein